MELHSLMYHHFWNEKHPEGQGALNPDEFLSGLERVGLENILGAEEWYHKFLHGKLKKNEVCITFDDNLSCQTDVALPILNDLGITAFWYVYTSPYLGIAERIELYWYFRTAYYRSTDEFYADFQSFGLKSEFGQDFYDGINNFPEDYKIQDTFYSREDRVFRYLRDIILGPDKYHRIMDGLIMRKNLNLDELIATLWIPEKQIRQLHNDGHIIGLHSHTHATKMSALDYKGQKEEYSMNHDLLQSMIGGAPITTMAHPCGQYNDDTLVLLKKMGIDLAWRADSHMIGGSNLEVPRLDPAYIPVTKMESWA